MSWEIDDLGLLIELRLEGTWENRSKFLRQVQG